MLEETFTHLLKGYEFLEKRENVSLGLKILKEKRSKAVKKRYLLNVTWWRKKEDFLDITYQEMINRQLFRHLSNASKRITRVFVQMYDVLQTFEECKSCRSKYAYVCAQIWTILEKLILLFETGSAATHVVHL